MRIRFEPAGIEVLAQPGETLFAVAMRAGLPVGNACNQEGICGRCGLRVVQGGAEQSAESAMERRAKTANRVDPSLRLSCMLTIQAPMTVTADYW